jgi:hypothetical protein
MNTYSLLTGKSRSLQIVSGKVEEEFDIQLLDASSTLGTIKQDDGVWLFYPNLDVKRIFFSFELLEIAEFIHMIEAFEFIL